VLIKKYSPQKNYFMKKIIGFLSPALLFTIISCSNEPAETKKEVIVVPVKTEKKEPVVIKDEPTSITLDKNGVKVQTKKVKVDIKPH